MIHMRTLLVLGAGASTPFGFPDAKELRNLIASGKLSDVLMSCGCTQPEVTEFTDAFRRSGFPMDHFLCARPEFGKIGRLATAAILLPLERDEALYAAGSIGGSDWCQSLWLAMTDGVTGPKELQTNQLKVITFNYERSFERYLHLTAAATFGLSEAAAFESIASFSAYHVRGSLGPYGNTRFQYGGGTPNAIHDASLGIRIAGSPEPMVDSTCVDLFNWSQQVFVLGFGFDPRNCAMLGFSPREKAIPFRAIYATGRFLTDSDKHRLSKNLTGEGGDVFFWETDCLRSMDAWAKTYLCHLSR